MSAASSVTSCLYCGLRGIVVITPLTESSARSGLPSSLPPTPLLFSHSAAEWFIWLPRHIHRHIGASIYWQHSQTLKHMATYIRARRKIGRQTSLLMLSFPYPCTSEDTHFLILVRILIYNLTSDCGIVAWSFTPLLYFQHTSVHNGMQGSA